MSVEFVNLHAHTNLGSMLDALCGVDELFDRVKELGQKALAITDHGTLAAHFDAHKAYKRTGVQFVPGCEMYFVHSYDFIQAEGKRKRTEKRKHLILLAQNEVGYKNLLKANYIGFQHFVLMMGRVFPRISWEVLEKHNEGLICTSACSSGPLSVLIMDDKLDEAQEVALRFLDIFGERFFVEIQPHHLKNERIDQKIINEGLIRLGNKLGIPLTVSVDTHYLTRDSEKYHDTLMAINSKAPVDDPNRHRYGLDEFYAKSGEEVYDFLSKHYGTEVADEALGNTVKIAGMCEPPDYMETTGNHLPVFEPEVEKDYDEFLDWRKTAKMASGLKEDVEFMRFRLVKGFKEKFGHMSTEERKERWDRVVHELKVLEANDFSSYMLVTADFINWSRENGILVGVGRGSVGGCMVAYLLGIHGVDPIEYGLLFERFQNAYKTDLPDIDTDFTSSGRDAVQNYVREKYGHDHCATVSNINSYTAKSVIPDLVKSMRNVMPGLVPEGTNYVRVSEAIKKAIPEQDNKGKRVKTLERAMELSADLRKFADRCPELMEYADQIVGMPKEFSTHAAAMVISDIPIIEFAPLRVDKNGDVAVQYEKNRCESLGLIKMDFLAISTLDVIDETFKNIRRLGMKGPERMEDIPMGDEETYKMIQNGNTRCVFQLGKSGMMVTLCKKVKPNNILDIAMVNALGRPSCSKEERQEYIDRRFGRKKISYLHPSLTKSLTPTYGLCVMEEQLMGVAQDVAGWDLNKADGLRKLTKLKGKNPELALQLEVDFIEGLMKKHDVEYEFSKNLWDQVVGKFSGYGFNKSHAVFYSINGYITAYLKCHYPAAFLAAYLKVKTERGGIHKDEEVAMAKEECRRMGIKIIPPDLNRSGASYEVLDEESIVMGFAAIKGLGEKAVAEIVNKQPYANIMEFLYKTDGRIINKTRQEVLAKAGCFDSFNLSRKGVHDGAKKNRDKMTAFIRNKKKDGYGAELVVEECAIKVEEEEWPRQELLRHEQDVLGELLTGNVNDMFPGFFTGVGTTPMARLKILPDRHNIMVEFLVKNMLREFKIKSGRYKGQMMIKYRVADVDGGETELTVWPDQYEIAKKIMKEGRQIRAKCQVSEFNGVKTIMLREIEKAQGL